MATAATYIDEMLDPLAESFTHESAQRLVALQPKPEETARMEELAAKANEGLLTPAEDAEYKTRITVGDMIAILKLKARGYLDQQNR